MRRITVSVLLGLLLVCTIVGWKNLVTQTHGGIVLLADGGSPMPPIPRPMPRPGPGVTGN